MADKSGTGEKKVGSREGQYSLLKIGGIWFSAVAPFFLLIAFVVPTLAHATGASAILIYWTLLPLNAAWLAVLSFWIIHREGRGLGVEILRGRLQLGALRDAKTGNPPVHPFLRIAPYLAVAVVALILGLVVPSIVAGALYFFSFPSFANLTEPGSPEFSGQWGWLAFVVLAWLASALLGEELLFRGVLLPKTKGVFGRLDSLFNAAVYALYYLPAPLLIPFRFLTGWTAAGLTGRYHSSRAALLVRGVEGAAVVLFTWAGVTSPRFAPLPVATAFPFLASNGSTADTPSVQALTSIPEYIPNSGNAFQVDLRSADLSSIDLRQARESLDHACFDSQTIWPATNRLPAGFDPQAIMETGKNPGVGLRELHAEGITGKGIGIAIFDQGLLLGHLEYADRLMGYEEITRNPLNDFASFHAAAVASIAVGKTTGVAPEASLYFIASNDVLLRGNIWQLHYYAMSVRRVIELNKILPADRKIRVISISIGSNPPGLPGSAELSSAMREAETAGIYTIFSDMTASGRTRLAGRSILADPDDYRSYDLSILGQVYYVDSPEILLIPVDSRTLADSSGEDGYFFCRTGGLSWMMPFSAALFALTLQVNPALTLNEFWELAFQTAQPIQVIHDGTLYRIGRLIDPRAMIAELKK